MAKKIIKLRRKTKSPNLVLPLLGISLFSLLGINVFLNRPRPTPLKIAEVAAPSSNCTSVAFADNFESSSVDNSKWQVETNKDGESATITNGKLTLVSPQDNAVMRVLGVPLIYGDFASELDIYTPNSASNNEASQESQFVFREPNSLGNYAGIARQSSGKIMTYVVGGYYGEKGINSYTKYADFDKNNPVRARIVRKGTTLSIYYKTQQDYILFGEYPDIADTNTPLIPRINLGPIDAINTSASVATFDRYILSCIPPAPPTISTRCDGNNPVADIAWDGLPSANGYWLGISDTQNHQAWYGKNVEDAKTTNSLNFIGSSDSNRNQVFTPKLGQKYYAWVWNGLESFNSKDFIFPSCEPKPPTPSNPRITCNPDGKSVRLMWDGVTDIETYKVRLDDKAGHVTNFDNLKDPQHIATISPDKTYSFWVHSHKGNYDSNQSTSIEFSCKVTSTPTPLPAQVGKPTVKPTAKPISKGDEVSVPSDTPKPSVKASVTPKSSPSNPSYVAPSPVSNYPEATEKPVSKNPISRFFTWLAGLFE